MHYRLACGMQRRATTDSQTHNTSNNSSHTATSDGDPVTYAHDSAFTNFHGDTLALSYDHTNACTDFVESTKATDHRVLGGLFPNELRP